MLFIIFILNTCIFCIDKTRIEKLYSKLDKLESVLIRNNLSRQRYTLITVLIGHKVSSCEDSEKLKRVKDYIYDNYIPVNDLIGEEFKNNLIEKPKNQIRSDILTVIKLLKLLVDSLVIMKDEFKVIFDIVQSSLYIIKNENQNYCIDDHLVDEVILHINLMNITTRNYFSITYKQLFKDDENPTNFYLEE